MNVLIVESAAKAKAINKYLGPSYKVIASYGHVRDLPSKNGSVEPDNAFAMHWDVDSRSAKVVKEIAAAVKKADKLILATDPDREGEAISWHLIELLSQKRAIKKDLPVERITFNAVTKPAVVAALQHPRAIDQQLVEAYLARRALDYLVGFTLSPVLWRKLPGARSAGRVQSVALRLVCDRESEIEAFRSEEYWSITATLALATGDEVLARLVAIDSDTVKRLDIKDAITANAIKDAISGGAYRVEKVEKKAVRRNPAAPFTTSTLQQEASRKLGFSAKQTMQVAQRLYEGTDIGGEVIGLITYMRTDGVQIIPEAVSDIRRLVEADYTKRYVPDSVRAYKTKAKNAQEAHEAVRPTDPSRRPTDIAQYLERDQSALYDLIWKRSVASQMASAELEQTVVDISLAGKDGRRYGLRANGSVVVFDGFLKLYEEGRDDTEDENARRLPPVAEGDALADRLVEAKQHFTEPPPRYTEATLVKKMEELGIGRPSTYASTMAVLQERDYVTIERKRLVPEDKGRLVTAFLANFFERYVQYDFTAGLEEQLDLISDGKLDWQRVLRDFWKEFTTAIDETKELRVADVLEALNEILGPHIFPSPENGSDPRQCPACAAGRLSLKVSGKFGAFIGCSNYPECRFTRQLTQQIEGPVEAATTEGKVLGIDPATGATVSLRTGRFGPYVQLGDNDAGEKPKRASLPRGVEAETVDLAYACKLLALPREIGAHPETGEVITAGLGRYGPFVLHNGVYANLETVEDVFTVGINRAVALLAEKASGAKGRFQRPQAKVLKDLGEHPEGGRVEVLDGRYGPYVKCGKINATLPKGREPASITLEEAVVLIAERKAKSPGRKSASRATSKRSTTKTADKVKSSRATKKLPSSGSAAKAKKAAELETDGAGLGNKAAVKKTTQKKPAEKTSAQKATAKKTSAKKSSAKKTSAKKTSTTKTAAKKSSSKKGAKKAIGQVDSEATGKKGDTEATSRKLAADNPA
ncbi:MAG: type I DNA topoisomerase [Hyphomicrobiaceae bacterium]